jgi:hypothetical protein
MFNHHLIKRSLASALVIAAVTVPAGAAQALQIAGSGGSSGPVPVAPPATSQVAPSRPDATSGSSFQWGDAGIGAAGATVLLGAGALGLGSSRRRRQPVTG